MFGKQDDIKHYAKVADHIARINPHLRAEVVEEVLPIPESQWSSPAISGLVIRVSNPSDTVDKGITHGWGFWVNPFDGNWVFRRAWISAGAWEYRDTAWFVGQDVWHWNHDEDLLHYRNFPGTTALLFFRDGPLDKQD